MEKYEMMHRWCNADFGAKNGWCNSKARVSCDSTYFYSYSSAYAMWVDTTPEHRLMIMLDYGASNTSCKHLGSLGGSVPPDVKVIRTHRSFSYGYNEVNFSKDTWQTYLPINLIELTLPLINEFKDSKKVGTDYNISKITEKIDDINWLFDNRKECKVKDCLAHLNTEESKLFRAIRKKVTAKELIDIMLGEGAYDTYQSRLGPQRKAERTRRLVAWWNEKHHFTLKPLKYQEIKKMPVRDRVTASCRPVPEYWQTRSYEWHKKHDESLILYLIGHKVESQWDSKIIPSEVTNRFTGEEYHFWDVHYVKKWFDLRHHPCYEYASHAKFTDYFREPSFNLKDYKALQNKDQWLKRFYQKCAIIQSRCNDLEIWFRISMTDDHSLVGLSDEEIASYNRIQLRYAQYQADEEAKHLAREAERAREAAEKLRLEAERKEKYASYCARGIQGYRDLYYEKLDSIGVGSQFGSEFFYGGNVLLRWKNTELIETSKNILITIPQAKKFWRVINAWHNNPETFNQYTFKTQSGDYDAISYKDDILTAGCHAIAYCEMKRMMDDILKREAA